MTGINPEGAQQPLKILMTADTVGGVWRYSLDLISGLTRDGAQVLLATMGPLPSEEQRQQVAALPNVAFASSAYALEWMPNPWADVDAAGKWLLELADGFGAGLIHLNGYAHAALPWQRPVVVVAHSCVFSWWRAVHCCAPDSDWEEYKQRVLAGFLSASKVVAPSSAMAAATAAEYGLPPESIQVIHNFSNTHTPRQESKQPFFLAAGRVWDQAKNISLLEQIAPSLHWETHISGGDHGPQNLPAARKAACFLGMLPYAELLRQMSLASVFVHPAFYEPFGLSILEAARRRCCLVLSDIPTLRELWQGAAIFINPRDPEQWIDQLNNLTLDSHKRHELAARAYSHAARYNTQAAIAEYRHLYSSLVTDGRQSRSEVAA